MDSGGSGGSTLRGFDAFTLLSFFIIRRSSIGRQGSNTQIDGMGDYPDEARGIMSWYHSMLLVYP